jgi:hypothetical protein
MMADGGNLYKDIGAPQWIIDWNQGIIDRYNGIIRTQEAQAEGGEGEEAQVQADIQKLQEDMKEAHENLPPFPTPPPEASATAAAGNATIPEGPGEFGPVVPPPFVPDDNQTQPGEEGPRAEEE